MDSHRYQPDQLLLRSALATAALAFGFCGYLAFSGAFFGRLEALLSGKLGIDDHATWQVQPAVQVFMRDRPQEPASVTLGHEDRPVDSALEAWRKTSPVAARARVVLARPEALETWTALTNDPKLYRSYLEVLHRDRPYVAVLTGPEMAAMDDAVNLAVTQQNSRPLIELARKGERRAFLPALLLELSVLFLFLSVPAVLAIRGLRARAFKRKVLELLAAAEDRLEVPLADLKARTGLDDEGVDRAVRAINTHGLGFLAVNRSLGTVVDGRLLTGFVFVDRCSSCGASFGQRFPVVMDRLPTCDRCGRPFDTVRWAALKDAFVASLRAPGSSGGRLEHGRR